MRRFFRFVSRWAWGSELHQLNETLMTNAYLDRQLALLRLHHEAMVSLFREKQSKIDRLQTNYRERTAPLREDLRAERSFGKIEDHLTLMSQAPYRHENMRRRGFPGRPSDGTVEGVPDDHPNSSVDQPFDGPRASPLPGPTISTRQGRPGTFTANGAGPPP